MCDEEDSGGKRRKSLESTRISVHQPQRHSGVSGPRRESLEALCSPSYIAKESSRPASRIVSIEKPEVKSRFSQDLSRDVEQINQELSQLLFSDSKDDGPKGGSMDTRRTRAPQSFGRALGRANADGGSSMMPWQAAEPAGEAKTSLPWMNAPAALTSSGARGQRRASLGGRSSIDNSPTGATAMPWDSDSGAAGSCGTSSTIPTGLEARRSRRSLESRRSLALPKPDSLMDGSGQ
mmetsp:Transcript_39491/g.111965  ORF Transcript_39491/g.111965 Transcript_39491/m.111965 type:complete len:236 (-) Transcript_39491:398-1105(-)